METAPERATTRMKSVKTEREEDGFPELELDLRLWISLQNIFEQQRPDGDLCN